MCRPSRWLPGLIPLFLLFLAAIGLKAPEIKSDLTARTRAAIGASGAGVDSVSVSGRDVSLGGATFSEEGRAKAVATADAVDGVRLVADGTTLVAIAKPFAFTAARDGDALTLKGSVPTPAAKASIAAAAGKIGKKVDDQTVLARGAAGGFESWVAAALAPLATLSKGQSELVDGALRVTGEAADQASYAQALAATKSLPQGLALAGADIKPPSMSPFAWSAASDGKTTILEGAIPSESVRADILAAAKAALPGQTIVDRMQVWRGGAEGFAGWAKAALSALGKLGAGKTSLSDATLALSGAAANSASYQAALAAMKSLPAGLKAGASEIAAPVQSPFEWTARSDGKSITLEGYVPSEEARAAIIAAARTAAPGLEIIDRMQIARGAPQGFLAAASAALRGLGMLGSGQVALSDANLSIVGVVKAGESAETLARTLAGLAPGGFRLAGSAITSPEQHPYVFSAKKASNGSIAVGGFAPSEALRAVALAAAKAAGASVSGAPDLAGGLPADIDFSASTSLGFLALGDLRSGEMLLGEDGLTIRGEGDEASINKIRAAFAAPPAGVRVKLVDVTASSATPAVVAAPPPPPAPPPAAPPAPVVAPPVPPPAVLAPAPQRPLNPVEQACQQQLIERIAQKNIQFRTGSHDIAKESEGLIEDLSKVLKSCPDVKVEVGGHTDNTGSSDFNKQLSLGRAKQVMEALVTAGVAADRLSAAGYGEERPIAPNDTREGRAQNRRTEFVVK